jgi:hypothetical protein
MDARNSSDAWDLRCLVRERLLEYLQKNHPESLPRLRGELQSVSEQATRPPESDLRARSHSRVRMKATTGQV